MTIKNKLNILFAVHSLPILVCVMIILKRVLLTKHSETRTDELTYVDNPVESEFPGHWLPISIVKRIMEMRARTTNKFESFEVSRNENRQTLSFKKKSTIRYKPLFVVVTNSGKTIDTTSNIITKYTVFDRSQTPDTPKISLKSEKPSYVFSTTQRSELPLETSISESQSTTTYKKSTNIEISKPTTDVSTVEILTTVKPITTIEPVTTVQPITTTVILTTEATTIEATTSTIATTPSTTTPTETGNPFY